MEVLLDSLEAFKYGFMHSRLVSSRASSKELSTMSADFSGFHGNYLKKKLQKNGWKDFWVVLTGKWLFFLEEKGAGSACGILELSEGTTCIMLGPSRYRASTKKLDEHSAQGLSGDGCKGFKFKIRSKRGFHLFKSQSLDECQEWIRSISATVKLLQDPSINVEVTSGVLTNRSHAIINISQMESDGGHCCHSVEDGDQSTNAETSRHSSLRGRLRRSFRSLRVLKSEISGNSYGVLK